MNEPFMLNNTGGGMGGAAPQQYMKLTTLTDDFDYNFAEYGEYKVSLAGLFLIWTAGNIRSMVTLLFYEQSH